MAHTYKKSASLHYASFLTLTEVKCFRYSASCCEMLFTESAVREMFCSIKTLFSCISSSPQFLPLFSPAIPSPPHSLFSVFPSFLIHFLCITPLLSTPIYSALPPPILHKHTLYFSLLPSVTLFPSSPLLAHSPPLRYDTFLYISPSAPLLSLCLFPGHVISCQALFSPSSSLLPIYHSLNITLSVHTPLLPPFSLVIQSMARCFVLNVAPALLQLKCRNVS